MKLRCNFVLKDGFMKKKEISIVVVQYAGLSGMPEEDQCLIRLAREAAQKAYAPYSGFKVGAALRLADGQSVTGNNQENASFPAGCCAERTALHWANANFPGTAVEAIAIAAFDSEGHQVSGVSPCGICRQALLETELRFTKPIRVLLDGADSVNVLNNAESLLPLRFDGGSLNSR